MNKHKFISKGVAVTVIGIFCFWAGSRAVAKDSSEILRALIRANDTQISKVLERPLAPSQDFQNNRGIGADLMIFAVAYTSRESHYYHNGMVVDKMRDYVRRLKHDQLPDGLFDSGNLDSPPDTSFMLKTFCKAQLFLKKDNSAGTLALREQLKDLILDTAEGVRTGGVHTPNHRWAISSALAHANALYPSQKYIDRIDDWLGEGIDQDSDGQFSERSPNYTADVDDPSLLDLAILLKRPALLDYVRKSLEMTIYMTDPNGEVETIASRRQDQRAGSHKFIWEYYTAYRYMAIHDNNGTFAAVARWIERDFLNEIGAASTNMSSALTCMLEYPEMTKELPAATPLPTDYVKVFPKTAMVRIRRGAVTATIYGGSDAQAGLGVGSGLATNPTFFKMHKGRAILESIRMTPAFFGTGFFYSDGLRVGDGAYHLAQTLKVPYHLPLPEKFRNKQGDYKLSADMGAESRLGRFFSKMDFADRPSQFRILKSEVTVHEVNGAFELDFDVNQYPGVPVTIELTFQAGGAFTGVTPLKIPSEGQREFRSEPDAGKMPAYLLKNGYGSYTLGGDTIKFGPGNFARLPGRMEGEAYTWVNGSLRVEGDRVYITGITPFKYKLILK